MAGWSTEGVEKCSTFLPGRPGLLHRGAGGRRLVVRGALRSGRLHVRGRLLLEVDDWCCTFAVSAVVIIAQLFRTRYPVGRGLHTLMLVAVDWWFGVPVGRGSNI